jgi:hypothetical protein
MEVTEATSDLEALERFVYDNPDLERIESVLDDFNLFTALDLVSYEVRHSAFLRWLLDPGETHGLGDYFLKLFLKAAVTRSLPDTSNVPSLFDIDDWDLDGAEVVRERQNIDVFVLDSEHQLAVVIENKVGTGEHSEQLSRYREWAERAYPYYRHLFVYLTVSGEAPSDEAYAPVSYSDLADLLGQLLDRKRSQVGDEILHFLEQYLAMVGVAPSPRTVSGLRLKPQKRVSFRS